MFEGAMTALVTPMTGGKVDLPKLAQLCEQQIQAGIDALVPCGTTGEASALTLAERVAVIRCTVDVAKKRVPVIAGAGANVTREAIELSRACADAGADALLHVTPYYVRPTQEGLFLHYQALAASTQLPIILYNVPSRTGCDLLPETITRLVAFDRIVGIKEATGNVGRAARIHAEHGKRLAILCGDDVLNYPLYCVGARGCISVTSNVAPKLIADCWDAFARGDHATALPLHERSLPLTDALFAEASPIPAKAALGMMGRIDPEVRLPLHLMSASGAARLRTVLQGLALIS